MKFLNLYSWLAGTMNDFTAPFRNDEILYNKAIVFWRMLDNSSTGFFIAMLAIGIFFVYYYYGPFNNQPGRKYTPKWWCIILGMTALVTFFVTLIWEYLAARPTIYGAWNVEIKIAFCNAIYSAIVYFLASIIVCQSNIKTKAYKLFK